MVTNENADRNQQPDSKSNQTTQEGNKPKTTDPNNPTANRNPQQGSQDGNQQRQGSGSQQGNQQRKDTGSSKGEWNRDTAVHDSDEDEETTDESTGDSDSQDSERRSENQNTPKRK